MKQKILVASYAKIILEFVSAFNFNLLSIYLYGKMVYLIAHRFLFFLVKPLATTIQHFPLSKTSTKTPVFLINPYHALFAWFSCVLQQNFVICGYRIYLIVNLKVHNNSQKDRARKGDLLLFSLIFICNFSIKYNYINKQWVLVIQEIKDMVSKENSEEISIPLPKAQTRNLE